MSGLALPKISIVTPSFNQGQFIEETIQSILAQRYPNIEHIVVDGGSTDETLAILERYQHHFAYCVSEKDRGQTDAINKGLARVTGDIVAVLNSDDVYLPGALDFVAKQFMEDPSLRWMTAPSLYYGPGLDQDHTDIMITDIPDKPSKWLVLQTVPHPSTFIRREVMEKHGVYDDSFFFTMDYEYWCRLAFGGEVCRPFKRPLSGFRLHEASKSMSEQPRRMEDMARVLEMYLPKLPASERERVRRQAARQWGIFDFHKSIWALRRGDRAEARRRWQEAAAKHPQNRFTRTYFTTWLRIFLNRG